MALQNNHDLVFKEVETTELNGNVRDAIAGFSVGLGIVVGIATLT